MISDIGHTAFACHDLDKTLQFYGLLGIREAFRLNHDDGRVMLIYLHVAGDRFIEVFPGGSPPDPNRRGSYMHLCLLTDDLHSAVEQLRGQGVAIEREPLLGLDGNWQAWLRDPDANAIELMQLAPDSPQKRAARGE